uniref:Uncharacterized protein n=1 Tax=viral metagenome TaxID=1070528 RepID=A0A6M3LUW4_9ZZZZ
MSKLNLYKGVFNWYGQDVLTYTQAKRDGSGFRLSIRKVAKKVDRTYESVYNYFVYGAKDNYVLLCIAKDGTILRKV